MAASLGGAIKQLIEGAGLGLSAYRDDLGPGTPPARYCTISEAVSVTTERLGDDGHDDSVTELVQVDLWQPWRAQAPGDPAEDFTLADRLHDALHGARLPGPPTLVRSCTVDSYLRMPPERDSNLVHHPFTLRIRRER